MLRLRASISSIKVQRDLAVDEAALLAGIPKGPAIYSPLNDYERSHERQQWILRRMASLDFIDQQTYNAVRTEMYGCDSCRERIEQ